MDEDLVDKALRLDALWRKRKTELDRLRHEFNELSSKIAVVAPSEREKLIGRARALRDTIRKWEEEVRGIEEERESILLRIPNIVHESVPIGRDETENVPIRYWGRPKVWRGYLEAFKREIGEFNVEYDLIDYRPMGHADLVETLGLADIARAARVAGARFFYLYNDLVWLDLALILYALDSLASKGFTIIEPPFMMRRRPLEGVISFDDFRDMIYKVENEDLYLVGTAEHPLAALHMNETLSKKDLPLLYAGVSPCFRKEAGAHGKDTKGIFRVHQFNKVEQYVFTLPEDSWDWHEKLIENAEELWRGLGLPYRIVNTCTGDLGPVAAKKYDLEAWMPAQGKYREMVSCSNTTDYQSYRLKIRYSKVRGGPAEGYVHTLNSTAIATTRAITAILENFQEQDLTIKIPRILRKYLEPFDKYLKVLVLD